MRRLVVVGAGGHAVSLTETLQALSVEVVAFVDEGARSESGFHGSPLLPAPPEDLFRGLVDFVVAIGDNSARERVARHLLTRVALDRFATLVHPDASVATSAVLGPGTVVLQGAVVGAQAKVGVGAIVNSGAVVEHECELGDFASMGPGAVLGGRTRIGARSAVAIGATVRHGISVGEDSVVGAASYLHRDLPARVVAYGVPAVVQRDRSPGDSYLV